MDTEKLTDLLKKTVAEVEASVSQLSDEELLALHDLEQAGQNRTTLLASLDRIIALRTEPDAPQDGSEPLPPDTDGAPGQGEDGASEGGDTPPGPANDEADDDDLRFADEELARAETLTARLGAAIGQSLTVEDDAMSAVSSLLDLFDAQGGRLAELEAELVRLNTEAAKKAKPKSRAAKPRTIKADAKADAANPCSVVFTGEGDVVVGALPELVFNSAQIAVLPDDAGWQLNVPIDLPSNGPRVSVRRAWLLDGDGKAMGFANVGFVPLQVGGGTGAQLARGMKFAAPEKDAA